MLPSAGQRGDLHGKRLHILVISDVEGIPGEVHAALLIVGLPIVCIAVCDSTFFCFLSQEAAGVSDDTSLVSALVQDTFAKAAHGHRTDVVAEHAGGTVNLQRSLCGIDCDLRSGTHRGDDTRLPGEDAGAQACHRVHTDRPERGAGQAGGDGGLDIGGNGRTSRSHAVISNGGRKPLCGTDAKGGKRIRRESGADSRLHGGSHRCGIGGEVISCHSGANTLRDIIAGGLHTFGRRMNVQRGIQRGLQIAGYRLSVAVPSRGSHAFRYTLKDVRTGFGGIQLLQEREDGLEVVQVFLLDFLALRDSGNDLCHIGG